MDERKYYLCELLLDRRRLYVVWYSDAVDGLVRLKDGTIASFADEHQVRAFCRENGISLMLEPPVSTKWLRGAAARQRDQLSQPHF